MALLVTEGAAPAIKQKPHKIIMMLTGLTTCTHFLFLNGENKNKRSPYIIPIRKPEIMMMCITPVLLYA